MSIRARPLCIVEHSEFFGLLYYIIQKHITLKAALRKNSLTGDSLPAEFLYNPAVNLPYNL